MYSFSRSHCFRSFMLVASFVVALSACGGGGGGTSRPPDPIVNLLPLPLPTGHGLGAGEINLAAGDSEEHGGVVVSCPAGGEACVIVVEADGRVSYQQPGGVPTVAVMPGPGQTASDTTPVLAAGENSTLDATLAGGDEHPVLSASIERDLNQPTNTRLSADVFVKSIRTDQNGTYVVTYVLGGTEESLTLDTGGCDPSGCEFFVDGRRFFFWSWTGDQTPEEDGRAEFRYMASLNITHTPDDDVNRRTWFVFGVRTEELPMGNATYHGRFQARSYQTANAGRSRRQNHYGTMRLVANFDMRQLEGRIFGVRGTPPGSGTSSPWNTSSFTLTNGRIVNGQFTADLTGVDSDPSASFDESVKDFVGHILGEFYGPDAEEVGGVVTATRDVAGEANDRVLYGFIGGEKTERLTGINDSASFVTGVYRDTDTSSTTFSGIGRATVESTGDVFRITYAVDGQTQTVELSESDFGANPGRTTSYSKTINGTEFSMTSVTDSFTGTRRYEHLDTNVWGIYPYPGSVRSSDYGFIVYGARTTDMPTTGTADYAGRILGVEWTGDVAVGSGNSRVTRYRGDVGLTADFGGSTVAGSVTNLQSRPGNTSISSYATTPGELNFNATISGSGLSATDLSASGALADYTSGSLEGAFYGPGAAEVGGIFEAEDEASNKLLTGTFAARKQ